MVKAAVDLSASTAAGAIRGLLGDTSWAGLFSRSDKVDFGLRNVLPGVGAVRR